MKAFMILALLAAGCLTVPLSDRQETLPVLAYQTVLPIFSQTSALRLKLEAELSIGKDGSVQNAKLLTSSGDGEWDARATEEIGKWRFLPATHNGNPVAVRIRQTIFVQFREPMRMFLAEIVCANRFSADSAYQALLRGEDFPVLARNVSTALSARNGGAMGEVDIRTLPFAIQKEVEKLEAGDLTLPLQLGRQFIIFKRLSSATAPS